MKTTKQTNTHDCLKHHSFWIQPRHIYTAIALLTFLTTSLSAQTAFTWQEIKDKFEAGNPSLKAAQATIDEGRANEITAYLRPNPTVTGTIDQINPFTEQPSLSGSGEDAYRPFAYALPLAAVSYLHERGQKRELRRDSTRQSTAIAQSNYADQERALLFTLRSVFIQVLQAKAVLQNARENLDYWDHQLQINQARYNAGDMALMDLNRLELQRVQFESDFEMANVKLRTSKIQILQLLNERTPIEEFDVIGAYDFSDQLSTLEQFRNIAVSTRPDLRAAVQSVNLAEINHRLAVANGSTDPTFSFDFARNPPIPAYMGFSVSIPLRIFDRNQGEKARTQIDISRSERMREAAQAQVFSDVDSAYYVLVQSLNLLRPYKSKYLGMAAEIRDRVAFSYKNGGSTLLDYLDAEKSYRDTKLAHLNLIGSYLTAAAQMNMAVGQEAIP